MAQTLVPNQDISVGGFTPTPLYVELSQYTTDRTIVSENNNDSDAFRIALSDGTTPGWGTKRFRVRWRKTGSLLGHTVSPTLTLLEGGNEIATLSVNDIGTSFVTTETTTFAPVSDWSNLEVQSGGSLGSGGSPTGRSALEVAWVEVQIPSATEVSGHVSMSSVSSLSSAGQLAYTGSASLTGSSSAVFEGVVQKLGSASMAGSSTMTAGGVVEVFESQVMSSTSTLSASGLVEHEGSTSLSNNSTLSATPTVESFGASILSGESAATFVGDRFAVINGTVDMSSTNSLVANATLERFADITLASTSQLNASGIVEYRESVAMEATSSLSSSQLIEMHGAATMLSTSDALFAGHRESTSSTTMTGDSTFAAEGDIESITGSVTMTGESELNILVLGPNKTAEVQGTYRLLVDVSAGKWRLVDIDHVHNRIVETSGARRRPRPSAGDAKSRVVTVTTGNAETISVGAAQEEALVITPCHKMNVDFTAPVR